MRLAQRFVVLGAVLGFVASTPIAAVYTLANGLAPGALVLCSLPLLALLALVATRKRGALALFGLLFVLDLAWVIARATRAPAEGVQVCVETACDGRGAFWQRVPDEHEAARAGLQLSILSGAVHEPESSTLAALFDHEYERVPQSWYGLPNALLMGSTPERIESQRWIPAFRGGKLPCLVFLHGFGGSLTLYLRSIVQSDIGKQLVVIAPALDNRGAWFEADGLAVLEHLLTQLPPEVDRSRVYLAGLSNGGIGVSAVLRRASLRVHFRGVVFLSGIGGAQHSQEAEGPPSQVPALVFSGTRDQRFEPAWVAAQVDALRSEGAKVEHVELDADHGLALTHATEWTERFMSWSASLR